MGDDAEHDPPITVRVPAEWLKRAAELVDVMAGNKAVRGFGKPTRSMIARLAMMRGIEALELEFGGAKKRRGKSG